MTQNPIPQHYLKNCLAMCLYFEEPVEQGINMLHELGVVYATRCSRNAWVEDAWALIPYLGCGEDGKPILGKWFGQKKSVRMRDYAAYVAGLEYPKGDHRFASSYFQPYTKVDGFSMHRCLMGYGAGIGWDEACKTDSCGPVFFCSVIPWGCDRAAPATDLFNEMLCIASRYGNVCHGVIDHDFYLTNRHGESYWVSIYPTTRERESAAVAWGTVGGIERVRLCRDPREGLVLSKAIVNGLGIATQEGLRLWKARHGFVGDMPTLEHHPSGLFVLRCTDAPADFTQSVRNCERTSDISRRVHDALCEDGYSRAEYAIRDEYPLCAKYSSS